MRTVYVFPDRDQADTIADLASWTTHPGLRIEIFTETGEFPLYCDWEPDAVEELEAVFGRRPGWAVIINVSGQIDGAEELHQLVPHLLREGGVAIDEYTDHYWTAHEIETGFTIDGLGFFDFRTSWERYRPTLEAEFEAYKAAHEPRPPK